VKVVRGRIPRLVTLQKLVDDQLAKGVVIENTPPVKKAVFAAPAVKPVRVNAPNSVFALGTALAAKS